MLRVKAIITLGTLLIAGPALAGKDVTMDQVPPEVRKTIEREAGGGRVHDVEREKLGDRVLYEVEIFKKDGQKWELLIGTDGAVVSREPD